MTREKMCLFFFCINDYSKTYRLYNLSTEKIIIIRDIIFYKAKFQTWSNDSVKQIISLDLDYENDKKKKKAFRGHTL